jgi:N utilization substance protein B
MAKPEITSRPRTAARVGAVQALFQAEQSGDNPETVIDQFIRHRLGDGPFEDGRVPDAHVALFGRIVRTAAEKQGEIDERIVACLPPDWPLPRLDPVLRALLRAGGAELAMRDGPPVAVVINEYLDVAHGFFQGDEARMANGVLETLSRHFRKAKEK